MNCPDCERTKEMLLEILRGQVGSILYDRHKGPSVTSEELIETLKKLLDGNLKDPKTIEEYYEQNT
jgi:plasmid rolling circle replication initiator protein Rep